MSKGLEKQMNCKKIWKKKTGKIDENTDLKNNKKDEKQKIENLMKNR